MVKVEDYRNEFKTLISKLPFELDIQIINYQLVGSTSHNGEGGDYDVVVLVADLNEMVNGLTLLGWDNESDGVDANYPVSFISMRKGNFNLILTVNGEFFHRMKNSAEVIRKIQSIFGRLDRADVCDIYSIILYGHAVDE
ncbi:hypothetical protein [Bacteriophage Phi NF-1]|uniref:Uncharacterized protein n=1 Tax=Bacteriophage Phi NF-1 TaxID=2900273 RepID=A0A976MG21_9CAUD|nr:hypothetical protein [Bacteriophage Phi NF-1]